MQNRDTTFEVLTAVNVGLTCITAETISVKIYQTILHVVHQETSRFLALILFAIYLHVLLFDPEDVGSTFLCNVGEVLPECTVLHLRRQYCYKW
jgi:hypothetical protein